MRINLLLFLLLPSLLMAGNRVNIRRTDNLQTPAGWIDRVSKRTQFSKVFEKDSLGSGRFMAIFSPEPLHYDSAGTWQNLEVETAPDTAAGYDLSYRTKRWSVDIDTTTGSFRFLRESGSRRGAISFRPGFSPLQVGIEYALTRRGIKSTYTLTDRDRLAWRYYYSTVLDTSESRGRGKGKVKNSLNQIKAEIGEFSAKDNSGRVMPVRATWTDDSLVVWLPDTIGYKRPFLIDPWVQDSTYYGGDIYRSVYVNNSWGYRRCSDGSTGAFDAQAVVSASRSSYYGWRSFLKVCFDSSMVVPQVDSAKLSVVGSSTSGTPRVAVILGTQTGAANKLWYNDFVGWSSDSLADWSVVRLVTDTIAGTATKLFNQTGRDSIKAVMNRNDTLRIAFVDAREIYATKPVTEGVIVLNTVLIHVFFKSGNPPGLSTVSDSLRAAVELVVNVDSTGGSNGTSVTFKLWPKGATLAGDTITRTRAGNFGIGQIRLYEDSLLVDTLYRWRVSLTNGPWTGWSNQDSFWTRMTAGAGGGGLLKVLGREVNRNVR